MTEIDPSSNVFLFAWRRALLVLHMGGSIVLIGAATHHALQMRHYLRGRFKRVELEKTYARVVAAAYILTFVVGAALYPTYRVHARGYYLDRYAPFFAGLFDVKEVFASLALIVAAGLGALASTLKPAEEKWFLPVYAAMSFIVCGVVWLNVIAGVLIVSIRGPG